MNIVHGFSDSLNILVLKWKTVRLLSQRVWIIVGGLAGMFLIFMVASSGTLLKQSLASMPADNEGRQAITLWLDIFLQQNAGMMFGAVFWALIVGILVIPLVGFSFSSFIPEGDLVSLKRNNNHKISDSVFLQFVSSISFVQILTLTILASVVTLDGNAPGYGVVATWGLWVIATLLTTMSAWFFEMLVRKYGIKAKIISLAVIAITLGSVWLLAFEEAKVFFGVGEMYTLFIQNLSNGNNVGSLIWLLVCIAAVIVVLIGISYIASKTLHLPELVAKENRNRTLLARLGFVNRNKISTTTEFITNMLLRQSNVMKPLLLSAAFLMVMSLGLNGFYQILISTAALIPVMVSLSWSINAFGILGSGTTWLLSLPKAKRQLLGSFAKIQYFMVMLIALIVGLIVMVAYQMPVSAFLSFMLSTLVACMFVTNFSLKKAMLDPHRYRVNIKGESILPPNRALSHMFKLFVTAFIGVGVATILPTVIMTALYTIPGLVPIFAGVDLSLILQFVVVILAAMVTYSRYNSLKRRWLTDTTIIQNIIKKVGV